MTEFIKIADSLLEKHGVNADDRIETKAAKHTPGPWIVAKNSSDEYSTSEFCRFAIHAEGAYGGMNLQIATTVGDVHYLEEQEKANANLIAAAPDLLEALNELLDYAWPDNPEHGPRVVREARAAINKAEGI
jgi:hypothetical protein